MILFIQRNIFLIRFQFNLMKRKGVYPYDYMDSPSKFNDTVLPSIRRVL